MHVELPQATTSSVLLAEPPLFRAPVAYVLRVFGPPRVEPGIPLRGASLRSLVGIAVKQCVTKETLGEMLGLKQASLAAGFTPLLGNRAGAPRLIEQSDSLYSLVSDSVVSELALLDDAERALTRSKSDVLGDAIDTTIRLLDSIAGPAFGGDANAKEYGFVYDREFSPTFAELAYAQLLRVCTALASRWDEADGPADTSRVVSSLLGVYDRSITGAGVAPWPFLRNAALVAAKGSDLDRDLVRNRLAIIAEEYGEVDSGVLALLEH